ncbi:hypothetical protein WA026_007845 [Henosepilachna vigintioctopunctata]|uniref:CCHC-type domain-containing protein n=1 Tax=Henosepilachna vigintioctopunctata TaxID=420089 RepID=A0AAW1U5P0_9CUCU
MCDLRDIMMWWCANCKRQHKEVSGNVKPVDSTGSNNTNKMDERLTSMEEKLENIMNKINKLEDVGNILRETENGNVNGKHMNYADKLKTQIKYTKNETLILAPRNEEGTEVIDIIKNNINPKELGIGVKKIKKTGDGKVPITCGDKKDVLALKNKVESELGNQINTRISQKRRPQLRIIKVPDEYIRNKEQLKECILKQNDLKTNTTELKIVAVLRNNCAIIEVDYQIYKTIMQSGKLKIGWSICRVYEQFNVYRCYKCNGYNHSAKQCNNAASCGKCASNEHNTKQCTEKEEKCINCVIRNKKFNLQLDTKHTVFNKECCVYVQKMGQAINNTKYEEE